MGAGGEGDVGAIRVDGGEAAFVVGKIGGSDEAASDCEEGVRLAIPAENLREGGALTQQNGGAGNEGYEITIGGDSRLGGGLEIAKTRGFGHQANAGGGRTSLVEDGVVVRVTIEDVNAIYAELHRIGTQVGGTRFKYDVAAVGADGGELAAIVGLDSGRGVDRNAADNTLLDIADEDVADTIGIAGDKIASLGLEDYIAAVGGKLRIAA